MRFMQDGETHAFIQTHTLGLYNLSDNGSLTFTSIFIIHTAVTEFSTSCITEAGRAVGIVHPRPKHPARVVFGITAQRLVTSAAAVLMDHLTSQFNVVLVMVFGVNGDDADD